MSETSYTAEVRTCLTTLGALLALTVVTVGLSYVEMSAGPAVVLGLAVASLKAAAVGAVFMHLTGERAWVYWTLVLTAVLVVVLFALVLWAEGDRLTGTFIGAWFGEGGR